MKFIGKTDCIARAIPDGGRRVFFSTEKKICFQSAALRELLDSNDFPELNITEDSTLSPEAANIRIESEGPIRIQAGAPAGAYYALRTLLRLRNPDGSYPTGVFEDEPALGMRGVHLTLGSGFMPSFSRMKEIIRQLAEWRINTLVLEYDDRFPWERHPELVHPNAWTKEELKELIRDAEDRFIEVIPLLDSLGHAQQYLKHPQHKHLAELDDSIDEMCPQNPEVLSFMEDLWSEVLEMHPHARYAHITGDEVFRLGSFCPKCRKAAEEGRLAEVYLEYYTALSRFILVHGKRPVIWDDMLVKYPDVIDRFPRDIIINNWTYTGYDADRWDFKAMTHCLPDRRKELEPLFAPSFDEHPDGSCRPYPAVHFHRSNGFDVIGATAGSLAIYPIPEQQSRVANQRRMAQAIAEEKGLGILMTFWSDHCSIEGAMPAIYAVAEYGWKPWPSRDSSILAEFQANHLGLSGEKTNVIQALDAVTRILRDGSGKVPAMIDTPNPKNVPWLELALRNLDLGIADASLLERMVRNTTEAEFKERQEIPLSPVANATMMSALPPETEHFPLKRQNYRLGSRTFSVDPDTLLAIRSGSKESFLLDVHTKATSFELLNYAYYVPDHTECMSVGIRYEDGSKELCSLIGKEDILDWWGIREFGKHAVPFHSEWIMHESAVQMFLTTIRNPHPDRTVRSLELIPGTLPQTIIVIAGVAVLSSDETAASCLSPTEKAEFKERIQINLKLQETFFLRYSMKGEFERILDAMLRKRMLQISECP